MSKLALEHVKGYDDGGLVGGTQNVGGFLGMGGSNLQPGTTSGEINQAYLGAQGALNQQGLVSTAVEGQTGQAIQAQENLNQQLQGMAQGQGPNPAQAQLAQQTAQNVNQQAALMAGQRGAAANPALLARQAAQVGAQTQQTAAGQAATQEAQQQISAQQNLANLSSNQLNQSQGAATAMNTAEQNEQGQLLGANSNYNNAVNSAQASGNALTGSLVGSAAKAIGSAAAGAYKGGVIKKYASGGGINAVPQSNVGQYLAGPSVAPSTSASMPDLSEAGDALGKGLKKKFGNSSGNSSAPPPSTSETGDMAGATGNQAPIGVDTTEANSDLAAIGAEPGGTPAAKGGIMKRKPLPMMSGGGKPVKALVSAGERYLNPDEVKAVLKGADPTKLGQRFPGKAKVKGDSMENDTIHEDLEEGGVVIPRHITMKKMSPEKEAAFVRRAVKRK